MQFYFDRPLYVLRLIQILLSLILMLQTLEIFALRSEFSKNGGFAWKIFRGDFFIFPKFIRSFFDFVYQPQIFDVVLAARLVVCALTLLPSTLGLLPALAMAQLLLSLVILWRCRGAFNGGSDFMSLILQMSLGVSMLFYHNPTVAKGALWYIAVQVCLSYVMAGVVKIKRADWMSGRALEGFLKTSIYLQPSWVTSFWTQSYHFKSATWGFLLFEVLFPVSLWMGPKWCVLFLLVGALFHLANFFIFGLNRFFWIWIAAYPAVYFCSLSLSQSAIAASNP